jgi:carbamoyl-phosphate synthase large subunit
MTNILLTSAGRRSYLVNYFKQALNGNGKVIATNMYSYTPAMLTADEAIVVPPSLDKDYIPNIVNICLEYDIDLICSLHDLDVFVLANNREQLIKTGSFPVIPSPQWARICLDKYECYTHLLQHGIDVPWTGVNLARALDALRTGELHFPIILKDRLGFGSRGLILCRSIDELKYQYDISLQQTNSINIDGFFAFRKEETVLIQQGIDGKEYCLNLINNLQGQYVCHFASEVHTMRAGETDTVTTFEPGIVGDLPRRLSSLTQHPGIWGLDIMYDQDISYVIDINPRFTGDYPFQQICGANIPAALISWVTGKEPDPAWLQPETGIRGYKDLVPTRIPEAIL